MENKEDARLYHRFEINNPRLCYVTQNGHKLGAVTELSYGGFSLAPVSKTTASKKKLSVSLSEIESETVELHFLDKSICCQVEERYSSANKIGYQLKHEQTIVLSFLKEIIPWIRAGAALSYLQKLDREGFEGELPDYLNFEGPIPPEIEWLGLDSKKSPNFSLTFNQDKVLYQLKKLNNQIETLHNVWPGAESGDLRKTSSLDTTILRSGLAILIGLSSYSENTTYSDLSESILSIYESENLLAVKKTG